MFFFFFYLVRHSFGYLFRIVALMSSNQKVQATNSEKQKLAVVMKKWRVIIWFEAVVTSSNCFIFYFRLRCQTKNPFVCRCLLEIQSLSFDPWVILYDSGVTVFNLISWHFTWFLFQQLLLDMPYHPYWRKYNSFHLNCTLLEVVDFISGQERNYFLVHVAFQ